MQQLNKEQQTAVMHKDGPMLVLAGPGSGKTAVLVNRVLHLVRDEHIDPYNILVLTFSRLAAEEMRSRFMNLADASYQVTFGTFHAIFYHILKRQGLYRTGEILTRNKKISLLTIAAGKVGLKCCNDPEKLNRIIENISIKKMGCVNPLNELNDEEARELELVYEPYNALCKSEGYIDFDDMVNECLKALKGNDRILKKWQERYRYILVDEFQDIDRRQYEVLRLLAGDTCNIFCVGDDDQSIYSFRGAEPAVMKSFVRDYAGAGVVELKINYRCPEEVIRHAGRLIGCNKDRFTKQQICYTGKNAGQETKRGIEYKCFRNPGNEAEYCVRILNEIKDAVGGKNNADACDRERTGILYRTSKSADMLEEALIRANIPYRRKDRTGNFHNREWVCDVTAYLKLAYGKGFDDNRDELFRILNRPERGLTRESITLEHITAEEVLAYYGNNRNLTKVCGKLFDDIGFLSGMNCFGAVNYIMKGIGLEKYIKEHYFGDGNEQDAEEAINELKDRARNYSSVYEWITQSDKMIQDNADRKADRNTEPNDRHRTNEALGPHHISSESRGNDKQGNYPDIELMTIHGSKGLEFDNVIMIGLQEGIFPGKRCETAAHTEEERRLFYVAMTRCRRRLWLLGIHRDEYGKTESRFIKEAGFNSETDGSII